MLNNNKTYKVLLIHNKYTIQGGEDTVFASEKDILEFYGNKVITYSRDNIEIKNMTNLAIAKQTILSQRTTQDLEKIFNSFQPDIIHAHNTFPLISPSLYWKAYYAGIPVVQTLHNFRLLCLNAMFLYEGNICEDCLGKQPWRGVARACYRRSTKASATLAGMLAIHRILGTFQQKVSRYIVLSEFSRSKFIEAGFPAKQIVVKPNFVNCKNCSSIQLDVQDKKKGHFLFVGRLSIEKGVKTLAKAVSQLPDIQISIVGEGSGVTAFDGLTGIRHLGWLSREEVCREMSAAAALVVPSICHETFGLVVIEAFACGLPVIASRIGSLANLVHEGETGLLFTPGDAHDLAEKISWACAHPEEMSRMGIAARQEYERFYTPEHNYQKLMDIYREAIAEGKGHDS